MVRKDFGLMAESLILPIELKDNDEVLWMQQGLMEQGYLVGAIRQPTVRKPIIRAILNLGTSLDKIQHAIALIRHNSVQ